MQHVFWGRSRFIVETNEVDHGELHFVNIYTLTVLLYRAENITSQNTAQSLFPAQEPDTKVLCWGLMKSWWRSGSADRGHGQQCWWTLRVAVLPWRRQLVSSYNPVTLQRQVNTWEGAKIIRWEITYQDSSDMPLPLLPYLLPPKIWTCFMPHFKSVLDLLAFVSFCTVYSCNVDFLFIWKLALHSIWFTNVHTGFCHSTWEQSYWEGALLR